MPTIARFIVFLLLFCLLLLPNIQAQTPSAQMVALDSMMNTLYLSDIDSCLRLNERIEAIAKEVGAKDWIGKSKLNLAFINTIQGDYIESVRLIYEAIDLFEKEGDDKGLAESYEQLAIVLKNLQKITESNEAAQKQLELAEKIESKELFINAKMILASNMMQNKDLEGAENAYKSIIAYIKKNITETDLYEIAIYNNLAIIYKSQNRLEKAIIYSQKSIDLNLKKQDYIALVKTYNNLASTYADMNQIDKADSILSLSQYYLSKVNAPNTHYNSYISYANYYNKLKRYEQEANYLKKAIDMKDSLNAINQKEQAIALEKEFKSKEDRIKIKLLEAEVEKERVKNAYWVITVVAIILIIVAILYSVKQKIKMQKEQKQKVDLAFANTKKELEIKNMNNEKLNLEKLNYQQAIQLQQLENEKMKTLKQKTEIRKAELERQLEIKEIELNASIISTLRRNEALQALKQDLREVNNASTLIKKLDRIITVEEEVYVTSTKFEEVNKHFFENLKQINPKLTHNDLKICVYARMNMSTKEIADITNRSIKTVEGTRMRIRKKLKLDAEESLNEFLKAIPLLDSSKIIA
ncbi:MAG: tetratricopeptide repeat protein [Bernardetiaceae bacterium]|nr:tetratricopeptide repeat protein [Bernardetiaceae bacterium]